MPETVIVTKTPAVDATPDYAAGDVIGGVQELANVVAAIGDSGVVNAACLHCAVDISAVAVNIVLFNANPSASTTTENGALAIHANDISKVVGILGLSTGFAIGTPSMRFAPTPSVPFRCPVGTSLFAVAVSGGAINLGGATDLTFVYGIRRDRPQ